MKQKPNADHDHNLFRPTKNSDPTSTKRLKTLEDLQKEFEEAMALLTPEDIEELDRDD